MTGPGNHAPKLPRGSIVVVVVVFVVAFAVLALAVWIDHGGQP